MNPIWANLIFQGLDDWLLPACAMFVVAIALLVWGYRAAWGRGNAAIVAFSLKVVGFLLLAVCLLEPVWNGTTADTGASLFVVLADNSQGMQIRDRDATTSRGDALRKTLRVKDNPVLEKLAGDFQLRRFTFDSRLNRCDDFSTLDFSGQASSIGAALSSVDERFSQRPLAGVLLFSDGNATDLVDRLENVEGLPPIYPVVLGSPQSQEDLAVTDVHVSHTSFEDAPITVSCRIETSGYVDRVIEIALLNEEDEVVEREVHTVRDEDETIPLQFRLRPETTKAAFYQVRVREIEEKVNSKPQLVEATKVNNRSDFVVDRGNGPYRVLYVTGRANWEYKFLHRAIAEDEQLQLVGLIRIADREPKFSWKGRQGETSNPLFRGFGGKDEETEGYDQSVLVRLGTRDEAELRDGFPKTAKELFTYDGIIIDDLEAGFFTHDQMSLVEKFVSRRGGGFLMLGGQESFREGKYERTPIAQLLPVYLDRVTSPSIPPESRLALTREGWLQPWARLRDTELMEKHRLSMMPGFRVVNHVRAIKPGASVIASIGEQEGTQHPALAVQSFGRGRAGALLIGDLWRWGMRKEETREDMNKAWRQMLRWLVADVPEAISLEVDQDTLEAGRPFSLVVRVSDEEYRPRDGATVSVQVTTPAGKEIKLIAEPHLDAPGRFDAILVPREAGQYRATALVSDSKGKSLGEAKAAWAVNFAAEEFRSLRPNVELMESIAHQTGGEVIAAKDLKKFVNDLPHRQMPVMKTSTTEIWHLPYVFLTALGSLVGEWWLRRWKGLP